MGSIIYYATRRTSNGFPVFRVEVRDGQTVDLYDREVGIYRTTAEALEACRNINAAIAKARTAR